MLECVINVSEGRSETVLDAIAAAAGSSLLDIHRDPYHHRSVFTLAGPDVEADARSLTTEAVARIDLRAHDGVHPRIGAVDVVPFVALAGSTFDDALAARDAFCVWAARTHDLPCFRYGPERSLPDVRRGAFRDLGPDTGPGVPHPSAGGCAVGARPLLVADNVWLAEPDLAAARAVASVLRGPQLRTLGLQVGERVQVSMNLIDPAAVGPAQAYDAVVEAAQAVGAATAGAELVGLVPDAVLRAVPSSRWRELDLAADRTIEARLARAASR